MFSQYAISKECFATSVSFPLSLMTVVTAAYAHSRTTQDAKIIAEGCRVATSYAKIDPIPVREIAGRRRARDSA